MIRFWLHEFNVWGSHWGPGILWHRGLHCRAACSTAACVQSIGTASQGKIGLVALDEWLVNSLDDSCPNCSTLQPPRLSLHSARIVPSICVPMPCFFGPKLADTPALFSHARPNLWCEKCNVPTSCVYHLRWQMWSPSSHVLDQIRREKIVPFFCAPMSLFYTS